MTKLLVLIVVSLTGFSTVFGQTQDGSTRAGARELIVKFVELNNKQSLQTDEGRLLFTGEASEWKMASFGRLSSAPDKIVSTGKDLSVARVQTVEDNSRVVDLYFYLVFNAGWKIRMMRALAQTGWLETIGAGLKAKTNLTPEEKETQANIELVLSSDEALAKWFQTNRAALDNLIALAPLVRKKDPDILTRPTAKNSRSAKSANKMVVDRVDETAMENTGPRTIESIPANSQKFPKAAAGLRDLHLSRLETRSDGSVEITIGGITDNTVGFIYSPTEAPPQIDGWRYIWVEKIAAGWYLFRTT